MTYPSFNSGDVLNAADMNAVGLWRITSGITASTTGSGSSATVTDGVVTVTGNATSLTISGAFSSTYDNYRIMYGGYTGSTTEPLKMRFGTTATGVYYGAFSYVSYNTTTPAAVGDDAETFLRYIGSSSTAGEGMIVDVMNPYLAMRTYVRSYVVQYSTAMGSYNGFVNNSTQYTSFSLHGFTTGTFTGGSLRVYGYRN